MPILMAAENMQNIPIGSALAYSLLGIAIVFVALIILWAIIAIMSAIFRAVRAKNAPAIPAASEKAAIPAAPQAAPEPAPGSAGDLMIHDVPERTAAILMAIVADKMGRPLNELRFISIKEVK